MFATAGESLNVYNINEEGELEAAPPYCPKPGEEILKIQWCHDNTYIALLGSEGTVEIVSSKDTNDIRLVHSITSFPDVSAFSFKRTTKKILALGNKLGEIVLYDTKNRSIVKELSRLPSEIVSLGFTPDDIHLVILFDKSLVVLDEENNHTELKHPDECSTFSFYKQCPYKVAVGCKDGTIHVWDLKLKQQVAKYHSRHTQEVTGLKICRFDEILMSSGMDYKLCFLDAQNPKKFKHMKSLREPITSMDVSPDNEYIIVGMEDGTLFIYDMRHHITPLATPKIYRCGAIRDLCFANSDEPCHLPSQTLDIFAKGFEHKDADLETVTATEEECEPPNLEKQENIPDEVKSNNNNNKELDNQILKEEIMFTEKEVNNLVMEVIKKHFNELEKQMNDRCDEFQMFISNEFDSLQNKMSRWDVFNVGNTSEVIRGLSDIQSQTAPSCSVKKSN